MRRLMERAEWATDTAVSVALEVMAEVARLSARGEISEASAEYVREVLLTFVRAAVAVRVAVSVVEYRWGIEQQEKGAKEDFQKYG